MRKQKNTIKLIRQNGRIMLLRAGSTKPVAVNVVWARPISGRGQEVSFMNDKKKEVLMIDGLHELDASSRAIAEDALECRYLIPEITKVLKAETHFGNRFWEVETSHGLRSFAMKDPNKNVTRLSNDHLIIRDVLGNRYEIPTLSELDEQSQNRVALVT